MEFESFATAELNSYDLGLLSISKEKAVKELVDELSDDLEDLNSIETKTARLEFFKVKNAKTDDYKEKVLDLGEGKKVIYGIRNKGGNPEIPFIQLRPNFQILSKQESLEIYGLIKEEFKIFSPLYLNFHSPKKINSDFFGSIYMVSTVDNICQMPKWPNGESICFGDITDNSYYDWYKSGYEEFHRDVPELKNKVRVNSCSSMEDSRDQGLLKYILFNGERIGLISGEKSNFLGSSGVYFHEIYISKKWKRRGIAKIAQREFIQQFCRDLEYVWGTIV